MYLIVTDMVNATSQQGVSSSALTKPSELPTQSSSSSLSLPAAGPPGKLLLTVMMTDIQQFIIYLRYVHYWLYNLD